MGASRMFSESLDQAEAMTELIRVLQDSENIVVLTGAGMSTESGIPDFRSDSGLWQDDELMQAMSVNYLRYFPERFWPKFKHVFLRPEYLQAQPNAGHLALGLLEGMGKRIQIFTQNVDGLHGVAGNTQVFELHGNFGLARCPICHTPYALNHILSEEVPHCVWENQKGVVCGHVLDPDTVLFGQDVRHYGRAQLAIANADVMLVLGTSLTVDPVAELPHFAIEQCHTRLIIVNMESTYCDKWAHLVIRGKVGEVLSQAVARVSSARDFPQRYRA
ncbi:NAD-dependent protein deacylase [Alicyclobacillaceae bacterium I2511]|nr:NAD-dependent protein deacylase [Alicyclobacillaceae bacterium I2511]